jgi:preprotein translocase subunit YajC
MMFILSLISNLSAQEAAAPKQGGLMGMLNMLMPFALIIAVFYFFMIRPQQKQRKKHMEFLSSIKKGDEVVTSSGIIGTVYTVSDKTVTIEVDENTKVKVLKGMVSASAKEAVL